MSQFLEPEEHVLSTLERDGSRRWLKPKLSHGKWLERRRWFAYLLIVIFTAVPFIKIGGKPMLLLDIPAREFNILGFTFLPTDTVLLAIFMVGVLLTIVFFTALFGRVWCGWACPQTVYMEFLFRPIERFFDGTTGRGGHKKNVPGWRIAAKYVVYFLVCFYLANTFLAYFVGVDQLKIWITQSPFNHPIPFVVMALVTIAMMFDFCFFREQMCLVACPYGRFQSVLLDQNSLIVAYDVERGEPRGRIRKQAKTADGEPLPVLGDCIACNKCVTTCPTGIDIRQGLQMECINCTQCIDACNEVMAKTGREPNLIRYSSQARDAGNSKSLLRARTIIYPLLLIGIATAFFSVLFLSKSFDAVVLRQRGNPFSVRENPGQVDDGHIVNVMLFKLTNRTDDPMTLESEVLEPEAGTLELEEDGYVLQPRQTRTFHANLITPKESFQMGRADAAVKLTTEKGVSRTLNFRLIGPYN